MRFGQASQLRRDCETESVAGNTPCHRMIRNGKLICQSPQSDWGWEDFASLR